jgi:hypothetical protein
MHAAAVADVGPHALEVLAEEVRSLRGQLRNLLRKAKGRSLVTTDVTFPPLARAWPGSDDAASFAA